MISLKQMKRDAICKRIYDRKQTAKETARKEGRWFTICMDCGKTVSEVNKDGDCKECELETERLRK